MKSAFHVRFASYVTRGESRYKIRLAGEKAHDV